MCPFKEFSTVSPVTISCACLNLSHWSGSRAEMYLYFFALSMTPDNKAAQSIFRSKILLSRAEDHQRFSCQHFVQGDIVNIRSTAQHHLNNQTTSRVATDQAPPDQKTSQSVPGSVP